uniref:RNA helicase n=1 Tax=Scophthalmus maximus TaxID=52904 RepID=A0A8D2ZMU0_SCOMX
MLPLQVENPSCLWGRVVRNLGGNTESTEQYNNLLAQMNLFYHELTQDLCKLNPTSIEEGQVCVVYWSVMKWWCRAVVESIIVDSESSQAHCLLVDHGERLVVASDQIRVAVQTFFQLPFWVRRFHLAGIKPTTLRVSVYEEKICVNDELVAKKFAYYIRESAESSELDEVDRLPIMLSSSILTQTVSITSNKLTAETPPSPGTQKHVTVCSGSWAIIYPGHQGAFVCTTLGVCVCGHIHVWCEPVQYLWSYTFCCTKTVVVPSDPSMSGILVHSVLPVQPCTSLDDAPITDGLRWVLRGKQYSTPSPADCYSWPAVSRGCNTVIVSHNADQPLSYLTPLLTHILLNSIFSSLTSSTGPIAVLLCPGWEKVQVVYDLLDDSKIAHVLHPVVALPGVEKDAAKTVRIPKNCRLLVTTPFSFVRLLSCHCFMFLRLYHLVLDEADQLFTLAPDQMVAILQHFQKVTSTEEKASCPQQLIAVAKRWTSHMESLLTNHMPYPCIVMTVPEEAALYGNVQQVILMTLETSKISELLGVLDFSPDVGQKTLIIANSTQEVEDVFKAVSNKSAFCLKTHEGLTHQFDFVIQQWRKIIGSGTHVILVTTHECLKCFGIRDATCIVHYGFPTSPKLFGSRLYCMSENFRNLSERVTKSCPHVTRSVLLISERNARHIVGVLRYLGRTNAVLPPELLTFAQGLHVAREDLKTNRPLCSYLKSFGVCRDSSACPDRHRFISRLDHSELPASGIIEVVPLFIKTASVFYGRIVRKEDGGFDGLASEMASYYADKKPRGTELLEGGLYAVQEDNVFHRVKILSVPDRGDRLFFRVFVRFIDVGKEEQVKSHQILQLPEQFHSLPGQALEIVVCRVRPVDSEIDWHPKVTRAISQKVRGLQHRARAVLSLGTTVFVDPMVRVSHVPGMKTVINEHSVQVEILNTGMGVSNQEHMKLLRALCQEGEASSSKEARKLSDPPHIKPCDPLNPVSSVNQSPVPAPQAPKLHLVPVFHPPVRWYQNSNSMIVTVKLMNPESQRCDFYPDRVIYSGRVNDQSYRADLELQGNIAVDRCCWEMKSNEPVLKLVKQEQGHWEKLLRNKNIFVSYDMEHFEDDEDRAPNGKNCGL